MQRSLRKACLLAACLAAVAPLRAGAQDSDSPLIKMLEQSQKDKRGVTLHVNGQAIGAVVVKLDGGQWVELRNQQYGRILVRIDRIDAVAAP